MGVFPETINDPKFVYFIYFVHTEHLRIFFFMTLSRLYTLFLLQSNYIILLKEHVQIELS